jgi:hypothetical protein
MDFKLLIKPIVFVDADEAVAYYEEISPGLGNRFYQNFLASIDRIQKHPLNYTIVKGSLRRYIVWKFPYKIFYTIQQDTIFIIGITHTKKSNAFIRRRLKKP